MKSMTKNKRLKQEYAEALLLYATTTEPLKLISERLGLRYNTVSNYMRRNCPLVIDRHKALLPNDEERYSAGVDLLRSGTLSPYQVMIQLGYGRGFLHFIQKSHPELYTQRMHCNRPKSRPSKVAKYSEAVSMLTEMKKRQYNVVRKVAEETGLNYDSFRMHIYTYHRELIGLDPAKNKSKCSPRYAAKYAEAVSRLASEPKQPENFILHVADTLGLSYHALRTYIYTHHPELAQKRRRRK